MKLFESSYNYNIQVNNPNIGINNNDNLNNNISNVNKNWETSNQNLLNNNYNININNTWQRYPRRDNTGNIGANLVLCNKYVMGEKSGLNLVLFLILGELVSFVFFIIFNHPFFPHLFYIIGGTLLFITEVFFILSYITEPGIIPKNHPDYIIKPKKNDIKIDNNNKNSINTQDIQAQSASNENKETNINKEIQNNEGDNANSDNDTQEIKPRIFTVRECRTCNIMRVPGVSHCIICDNCVINFDHHCTFIGNCVGKRNHKFFYLFNLFGTVSILYFGILQIITIAKVFIISPKGLYSILWNKNKYLFILSIIIIVASIYSIPYCRFFFILIGTSIFGYFIFIIIFYVYYDREGKPFYYNPFHFGILAIIFCYLIPLGRAFYTESVIIGRGYTLKQMHSIEEAIRDQKSLRERYTKKLTYRESFNNIWEFLTADRGKSLIVPERDLITNK